MSWESLCEVALPSVSTELTFVDYFCHKWKCLLDFGNEAQANMTCRISGGWINIYRALGLIEGLTIKPDVKEASNNI